MRISTPNGATAERIGDRIEIAASDKLLGAAPAVIGAATGLESTTLQPAKAALAAMPEIDLDKVETLREALARGEIRFDAGRLAQLIQRFHGGRG